MSITVTPAGSISLCRTNLENDYKNTLSWASVNAQTTYFNNLPNQVSYSDYTYMKKDGKIRVGTPIDDIINYNYCYYNNSGFTTKRYYCFITRMEYVNENCTDIYIETDVFNTWYFDIVWNRCFVEREHVNDDTIGIHTVPEGLETGDYVCNATGDISSNLNDAPYIVMGCTWLPDNTPFYTANRMFGKVYSGVNYIMFQNTESAAKFIQGIDDLGHDSSVTIVTLFVIPLCYLGKTYSEITWQTGQIGNQDSISFIPIPNSILNSVAHNITISMPSTLNGYTPKNNKLFTYPYNVLTVTNNVGTASEFKYEDFINNIPSFEIDAMFCVGGSAMLYPNNYKKESTSRSGYEWGMPIGKFPQGSWNSDAFTNWMTQNSINIAASIAGDAAQIATGAALINSNHTIGGSGNAASGLVGIMNTLGTIYQHALVPRSISGQVNSGDMQLAISKMSPTYYKMSVRYEYAEIIDNYFSAFGYKVNTIKQPNITGRTNWNFIKTIDCNCDGNIPQEDLETIKRACNEGITFWHNPANMYNYSLSNNIVS